MGQMELSFSCGKEHASQNHETRYDFLIQLPHLILIVILIYVLYICLQNQMLHDPNLLVCLSFLKHINTQTSFFCSLPANQPPKVIFST